MLLSLLLSLHIVLLYVQDSYFKFVLTINKIACLFICGTLVYRAYYFCIKFDVLVF